MKTVCIVLTSRGNYAKMKSLISELERSAGLKVQMILGGSLVLDKYGKILSESVTKQLVPDREINFVIEGETLSTMAKSSGIAALEFSGAFEQLKPDMVIVIADRFECLPIAMSAVYMNIPVVHIEGGEVTGSIDESIRHAITKLAHLHFPASDDAAQRIIKMGEDPKSVFNVGSTSFDVLYESLSSKSDDIFQYQCSHGTGDTIHVEKQKYIIVIQHPVTTEYNANYYNITQTIKAVSHLGVPTFWIWPNMDAGSDGISKGLREFIDQENPKNIHFFKSLPIEIYGPLLNDAGCLVGNSSSGIREAAFLGTPVVNIGTRQTGRERCDNVTDVAYDTNDIESAIFEQLKVGSYPRSFTYGDGEAASKIVKVLNDFKFTLQKKICY